MVYKNSNINYIIAYKYANVNTVNAFLSYLYTCTKIVVKVNQYYQINLLINNELVFLNWH